MTQIWYMKMTTFVSPTACDCAPPALNDGSATFYSVLLDREDVVVVRVSDKYKHVIVRTACDSVHIDRDTAAGDCSFWVRKQTNKRSSDTKLFPLDTSPCDRRVVDRPRADEGRGTVLTSARTTFQPADSSESHGLVDSSLLSTRERSPTVEIDQEIAPLAQRQLRSSTRTIPDSSKHLDGGPRNGGRDGHTSKRERSSAEVTRGDDGRGCSTWNDGYKRRKANRGDEAPKAAKGSSGRAVQFASEAQ